MDWLSPFFAHFSISARVFFSGQLCGVSSDHHTGTTGHLHVVRSGALKILQRDRPPIVINEPTALFYPRPGSHTFEADKADCTDIVCAFVEFGAGMLNPLVRSLPPVLIVPLASVPELAPTAHMLFAEAFGNHHGRQAAVDRLLEYFLVLLLRTSIDRHLVESELILGLADPRLSGVMAAIHGRPQDPWSLDAMAEIAGMSRARFAAHFLKVVGVTPFSYLATWRVGVAQGLLKRGEPLKMVAPAVGYATSAALAKAFCHQVGMSPTAWLATTLVRTGLA
jgi:AraC-like DNA-binding protein